MRTESILLHVHLKRDSSVLRSYLCLLSMLVFLVFKWYHHYPNLKTTNSSEVLVLSDIRPSKDMTFYNVQEALSVNMTKTSARVEN